MVNRLSHSAINRYQQCSMSYRYHYVDGYRERTKSGALIFGSAMDAALNVLLSDISPDENNTPNTAIQTFDKEFTFAEVGKKNQYIPSCEEVVYAASDFDADLLEEEDLIKLQELHPDPLEGVKTAGNMKKGLGWNGLTSNQRVLYNTANWLCLRRKGHLMIQAYQDKIIPKIKRVLAVQKRIEIKNNVGDGILGFVDIVVEWEDGRIVILDNKTSSIEYEENAVLTSPQLTLYVHALKEEYNTRTAGFIVMRKGIIKNKKKICKTCFYEAEKGARHKTCNAVNLGKRCDGEWAETIDPQVDMQVLINDIPERSEDIVMENFDSVNQLIKTGVFVRNFNSCDRPFPCAFKRICWSNDYSDVIVPEEG